MGIIGVKHEPPYLLQLESVLNLICEVPKKDCQNMLGAFQYFIRWKRRRLCIELD